MLRQPARSIGAYNREAVQSSTEGLDWPTEPDEESDGKNHLSVDGLIAECCVTVDEHGEEQAGWRRIRHG